MYPVGGLGTQRAGGRVVARAETTNNNIKLAPNQRNDQNVKLIAQRL